MHSKILYIYDSIKLFEVLNEIKNHLNFAIKYIDKKDVNKINFSSSESHLVISLNFFDQNLNFIKIDNTPISIQKLIEVINLNFIKKQFIKQSVYNIGKYNLDLNSRVISCQNIHLDLTEKEVELLMFINQNKFATLKLIQKQVWGHTSDLETHTVETHIYRLRKKMKKIFQDDNFIGFENSKYYLIK
jgi:hypothetical protein